MKIVRQIGFVSKVWAVAVGVSLLSSSGCTSFSEWVHNGFKVGPNYQKPGASVASNWIEAQNSKLSTSCPNLQEWWKVFDDPVLNHLVETAYRQNPDLRIAGSRILQTRAERGIAVGRLFPQQQDAFADYKRFALSVNTAQFNFGGPPGLFGVAGVRTVDRFFGQRSTGFNLSWELDFWGRFRRGIEAADAEFDASVENYDDVLVLLIGEVAAAYVELRTLQQRIKYADENIAIQEELTEKAKVRFQQGAASKLDLVQIRSNLTDTKAFKQQLELNLRRVNNQLCILLGIPPRDLTKEFGVGPIPVAPPQLVVGVPADLLRRRPDVRLAERLIAAQSARIGVAEADLYPRLSIIGTMGWQAEEHTDLFTPQSFFGNIAPTLRWDILNYGRLLNNIRVQDALFQQTVSQYERTVLQAGKEVEDGMIFFIKSHLRALQLTSSADDAKEAVEIVREQVKEKAFDINRAFVTSNFLVQQQDKLAQTQGNIALSLIQVYRALGGGWEIRLQDSTSEKCRPNLEGLWTVPKDQVEELPAPTAKEENRKKKTTSAAPLVFLETPRQSSVSSKRKMQ